MKKPKFNVVSYSAGLRDGMEKMKTGQEDKIKELVNMHTKRELAIFYLEERQNTKEDILKLIDNCPIDYNCKYIRKLKQKIKEIS